MKDFWTDQFPSEPESGENQISLTNTTRGREAFFSTQEIKSSKDIIKTLEY